MGPGELAVHLAGLLIWVVSLLLGAGLSLLLFLLRLMRGQLGKEEVTNKEMEVLRSKKKSKCHSAGVRTEKWRAISQRVFVPRRLYFPALQ